MTKLSRSPKDLATVVCDPGKALVLMNVGTEVHPELKITDVLEAVVISDDDYDYDRAGRRYDGGGTGNGFHARSALEEKDVGRERAIAFAGQIAGLLEKCGNRADVNQFLVAAPPEFLGMLRDQLPNNVQSMIVATTPKHLTDLPTEEIGNALFETW